MRSLLHNVAGRGAIPMVLLLLLVASCKPASEIERQGGLGRDYPWGDPPADYPKLEVKDESAPKRAAAEDDDDDEPSTDPDEEEPEEEPEEAPPIVVGEDATTAPDGPDAGAASAPDAEAAPQQPEVAIAAPDALPPLDPALQASLEKRPTSAEKLEARRLNSEGLKRHKLKDFSGAAKHYLEALDNDPTAMLPRYNLACALSLSRQPDLAIQHLLVHQALGHKVKLQDARADPDFESMRQDPRFRKLTGYAAVRIYYGESLPANVADDLPGAILKTTRYPATVAGVSPIAAKETLVYYRERYLAAARQVADVLGDRRPAPAPARLASEEGDVFVIVASVGDVAAVSQKGLEAFFDTKLEGRSGARRYSLTIKATTFFDQTILDGPEQTTRRGNWKVDGDELVISYRETRQTEADAPPPVEASDRVTFRVDGTTLIVDGVRYTRP